MEALATAIRTRLAADGALTAMLGVYSGAPAIFVGDLVPADAPRPYVILSGAIADVAADTKSTLGRSVEQDVRCYADGPASSKLIESIAERVRAVLHRAAIYINGFSAIVSDVDGPIAAETDGRIIGRIVTAHYRLEVI
jgi:hypothetical protein